MAKKNRKKRVAMLPQGSDQYDQNSILAIRERTSSNLYYTVLSVRNGMQGNDGRIQRRFRKAITYEEAKMDLRTLKAAFNHYGITISDDVRNRLFSANASSAKELRNSIVHGISKKNLDISGQ